MAIGAGNFFRINLMNIKMISEAPVAPQHVRVTNITPVSACITWYPSNSNAEHVISLNAIKIGVCPPSVFQVCLYFKPDLCLREGLVNNMLPPISAAAARFDYDKMH